jgi:hypothetical protein
MFWCTNCNGRPCINGPNGETSFSISDESKRINKLVRLSSSLHLMKKATQTINIMRPTFKNTSDRFQTSRNPITNKRGVDKKHNSYARYLARKKGKTICCCACTQIITQGGTGVSWPTNIPIGSAAIQVSTGATGVVVAITTGGGMLGDIDTITIRSNDCKFIPGAVDGNDIIIGGASGGGGGAPGNKLEGFNVSTINNCNNPPLPNSNLIIGNHPFAK